VYLRHLLLFSVNIVSVFYFLRLSQQDEVILGGLLGIVIAAPLPVVKYVKNVGRPILLALVPMQVGVIQLAIVRAVVFVVDGADCLVVTPGLFFCPARAEP